MTRSTTNNIVRTWRGITLMELMVSMFILGLTSFVILNISIKAYKLHARMAAHIEPQASAMLAFKRMEREIRQAMLISTHTPLPSIWIEIQLPKKDADGLNELSVDSNGRLILNPGKFVRYFLGTKLETRDATRHLYLAQPSVDGTVLFRAETEYNAVTNSFDDAKAIIEGIVNPNDTVVLNDPDISRAVLEQTMFSYFPFDDSGTPDNYADDRPLSTSNLIAITLIVKSTLQGKPIYHPLQTNFCLRNVKVE